MLNLQIPSDNLQMKLQKPKSQKMRTLGACKNVLCLEIGDWKLGYYLQIENCKLQILSDVVRTRASKS
ncbi:hypothetical protein A3C86_03900 [Candidatus Kaiserbacteria bacterium RIFCSPHIGHO2_02_FULL_49_16]|uniref:Uncharacterized protein n=1 Tax=Candidatus Kaiserbacteria bacterium RIFCSPHIGHO2_02_FULL_49_16 TaxID=1798490 RepID=A0A1F6DDX0_9BACT|nr:MAG: hypothetical protein A3C86_03900 [Candidatus Kaiserbacteria bacterium RIFCSPHIGHO2_02_FULL_49_16]